VTHEDDGASADAARGASADTRRDAPDETDADESPDDSRSDRLERHPTPGPRNSLWSWPDAKSPLAVVRNYVVIVLARICPSLRLKNWLLGRIGVTVGAGVAWGLESTPDVFWPERITVGDDAIIGYDATLLCHEFLQAEYRLGDVVVGEGAMIGAGAVVLPGVTIGEGARVAANSLVDADVPPQTTVAGVPAEVVSRADVDAGEGSDAGGVENAAGTGETTD
jgi:maltose O-acetyltransferase